MLLTVIVILVGTLVGVGGVWVGYNAIHANSRSDRNCVVLQKIITQFQIKDNKGNLYSLRCHD